MSTRLIPFSNHLTEAFKTAPGMVPAPCNRAPQGLFYDGVHGLYWARIHQKPPERRESDGE